MTTNPNRIEQVTAANEETNARLAPINPPTGWQPSTWVALGLSVAVSVLSSVGLVFAAAATAPVTAAAIIGAVVTGISTGLASFAGLKSAGTHPPAGR